MTACSLCQTVIFIGGNYRCLDTLVNKHNVSTNEYRKIQGKKKKNRSDICLFLFPSNLLFMLRYIKSACVGVCMYGRGTVQSHSPQLNTDGVKFAHENKMHSFVGKLTVSVILKNYKNDRFFFYKTQFCTKLKWRALPDGKYRVNTGLSANICCRSKMDLIQCE